MIDIVMPIWNRKEFLALTLKSLDQHMDFHKVHRMLLLDDFSTDGAAEVAKAWAAKHPCAVYKQARNPSMSTSWPLFEAFRILNTSKWLAIWLSDWYMCQPLIPVLERAMGQATKDVDVISSLTLRVTKDTEFTPKQILTMKRSAESNRSAVRGGFNCFRSSFLRRVRPRLTDWGGISSTFNRLFRVLGIKYKCFWITPPPAFLHLDEDIPGNKLTQHFYKAEHIDVPRILGLVKKYAKNGWCRNEVKGNAVVRAHVGAVGVQKLDPRKPCGKVAILPKAWKRRGVK